VKYRKKVLEDGVVEEMGVSGGGSSAIWSATTSNMIFKAKADSRYINAIQRNFPEDKKVSVIFPRHNRDR